ncbi:MAG: hypothetical protein JXR70_00680 [Spirochaetales bacterium]|nr:hypothetical protein [Spirochaetales bacterium]
MFLLKKDYFLVTIILLYFFLGSSCDSAKSNSLTRSFMEVDGLSMDSASEEIKKEFQEKLASLEKKISAKVKETEEYQLKYKQLANSFIKTGDLLYEIGRLEAASEVENYSETEGDYYKVLALAFIDREMYEKAFEALKKAILAFPKNAILYQLAGASAGWVGKSYLDPADGNKKDQWFDLSRVYYQRSLELDPKNRDSLYGIAILYSMELGMPGKALEYLDKLIAQESRHRDALFLRAIIYYQLASLTAEPLTYLEKAMDQYDEIITLDFDQTSTIRAGELKKQIAEEIYGIR